MIEVVVISGKGGTGKTTILARYAMLLDGAVLGDCDVDAPNLHMLLKPSKRLSRNAFVGSKIAVIEDSRCNLCGECLGRCRFDALELAYEKGRQCVRIDSSRCEGCAVCMNTCEEGAIKMRDRVVGEWFVSETDCGTMVHAALEPGAENSGRLVAMVKQIARKIAKENDADLILIDGPPGIGCPVISTLSGANLAVIVSEPTISGLCDFRRVADLASNFGISCALVINKSDLNDDMSAKLRNEAEDRGVVHIGSVPYDERLQMLIARGEEPGIAFDSPAVTEMTKSWDELRRLIRI